MKNECNIIRDILPLYVENMVSADTSAFVEEHLEKCAECRAELEDMKKSNGLEKNNVSVVRLKVSGAFHSPYMKEAAKDFRLVEVKPNWLFHLKLDLAMWLVQKKKSKSFKRLLIS